MSDLGIAPDPLGSDSNDALLTPESLPARSGIIRLRASDSGVLVRRQLVVAAIFATIRPLELLHLIGHVVLLFLRHGVVGGGRFRFRHRALRLSVEKVGRAVESPSIVRGEPTPRRRERAD